jgi:hypothetical protein
VGVWPDRPLRVECEPSLSVSGGSSPSPSVQDGVLVDPELRREIFGLQDAIAGPGFAVGDRSTHGRGDLIMQTGRGATLVRVEVATCRLCRR